MNNNISEVVMNNIFLAGRTQCALLLRSTGEKILPIILTSSKGIPLFQSLIEVVDCALKSLTPMDKLSISESLLKYITRMSELKKKLLLLALRMETTSGPVDIDVFFNHTFDTYLLTNPFNNNSENPLDYLKTNGESKTIINIQEAVRRIIVNNLQNTMSSMPKVLFDLCSKKNCIPQKQLLVLVENYI